MKYKGILLKPIVVQRIITKTIDIDISQDRDTEIRMKFPRGRTSKDEYKVIE